MEPCPRGTTPYRVREGDTLWQIAQRYNITVETIRRLNPELDRRMLTIGQVLCLPGPTVRTGDIVFSASELGKYLRSLWEQHVFWTRLFMISTVFSLSDAASVTDRLIRNPKDFGAALRPIYGEEAASGFSDLLTAHLTIAAQLVRAAMTNDAAAAARYEKQWYQNADEIAAFLARLNPHWTQDEWRRLLHNHLAMTKAEAADIIGHNDRDSISVFDRIEKEALEMADLMTAGIVRQYPGSFTN